MDVVKEGFDPINTGTVTTHVDLGGEHLVLGIIIRGNQGQMGP